MSWKAGVKPSIPTHYFMTAKGTLSRAQFLQTLEKCFKQGYLFCRFRAADFDPHIYAKWAPEVVALANAYHAHVMVDTVEVLEDSQAHGLHATQDTLLLYQARPVSDDYLFAASVHDLHTCAWANRIQTDFVTLSPVKATTSHPGAIPLGWEGFQSIAQHSACPVYALGGLMPQDVAIAQQHGAYGVAMIRGVWG